MFQLSVIFVAICITGKNFIFTINNVFGHSCIAVTWDSNGYCLLFVPRKNDLDLPTVKINLFHDSLLNLPLG